MPCKPGAPPHPLRSVICLGCGRRSSRHAVQAQLAALNPAAAAHVAQLAAAPPDVRREREQALRVGTSGDAFRVVRLVSASTIK